MITNKLGLATVVLGSALTLLSPVAASARDRDDYRGGYGYGDMSRHERHEMQERREREYRRWLKHHRRDSYRGYYNNGYYNNGYRNNGYYNNGYGYGYAQPRGYYDQYGYWHQ